MSDRLTALLQFYQDDPSDPFNVYALGLEYLKSEPDAARHYFGILLEKHPGYLPTYYHAAKFFADNGEKDKARSVFEKGIDLARQSNDNKAWRELKSAYDELLFEEDD